MRVINKTDYCTADICRLIYRVAQDHDLQGAMKRAQITVRYRRGWVSGRCTYGTLLRPYIYMTLYLDRVSVDAVQLAHTIGHELGHARGLKHTDMRGNPRYEYSEGWKELYSYALQFPINHKLARVKPSLQDRRTNRLQHANKMWERAKRRARLAVTIEKRWKRRALSLERTIKMAAAQQLPEQTK